jgi:hypothetical protein
MIHESHESLSPRYVFAVTVGTSDSRVMNLLVHDMSLQ